MLIKPLKTIIFTIILGMVYIMPTVARAACAENEIDVLGDGTQCELAKFTITTTEIADGEVFQFYMSAKGTFYVDCGAGGTLGGTGASGKTITRSNTTGATYTCTYAGDTEAKTIRFGGIAATGNAYVNGTNANAAAIRFNVTPTLVAGISGSLGAIFPSRGTASAQQPRFYSTFYTCKNLAGTIPENLFDGISGAPASYMFSYTFSGCSGLTGSIPENLFDGISGAPAHSTFNGTFFGCSGLTGSIPENLFAGISGAPALNMFSNTFYGCSGLTGSIPENLFAGISGAPATGIFGGTFSGCSGLTGSIPENLFAGISGAPKLNMFSYTFSGCSGLTGSIPENLFDGISGAPEISMFEDTFSGCSGLTGSIPENLFAGISGAPKSNMFGRTFYGCSGLTGSIPENLFAGISGAPATSMFGRTFSGCSGLTGSIPENLFAGISGAPKLNMFNHTFYGCSGLTGSVPPGLFGNLSGAGQNSMFSNTFSGCSNLSGYVPKELFENITSSMGVSGMFTNTNLYTECPCGTKPAETGWGDTVVDGRAVCEIGMKENEHIYNDVCVGDCAAGITKIKTSTGLEFPLFDTKPTTPALHIKHNGTICYTPMELGDGGANSMNIMSGGETYHLGTLE